MQKSLVLFAILAALAAACTDAGAIASDQPRAPDKHDGAYPYQINDEATVWRIEADYAQRLTFKALGDPITWSLNLNRISSDEEDMTEVRTFAPAQEFEMQATLPSAGTYELTLVPNESDIGAGFQADITTTGASTVTHPEEARKVAEIRIPLLEAYSTDFYRDALTVAKRHELTRAGIEIPDMFTKRTYRITQDSDGFAAYDLLTKAAGDHGIRVPELHTYADLPDLVTEASATTLCYTGDPFEAVALIEAHSDDVFSDAVDIVIAAALGESELSPKAGEAAQQEAAAAYDAHAVTANAADDDLIIAGHLGIADVDGNGMQAMTIPACE